MVHYECCCFSTRSARGFKSIRKKSCYFGFHSEVKFLMSCELIYFATFSCNFFGCLCSKVSYLFNFGMGNTYKAFAPELLDGC